MIMSPLNRPRLKLQTKWRKEQAPDILFGTKMLYEYVGCKTNELGNNGMMGRDTYSCN